MKKLINKIFPASRNQVVSRTNSIMEQLSNIESKLENLQERTEKELRDIKKKTSKEINELKKQEAENHKYINVENARKFEDTNKRIIDLRERFINAELRELLLEQRELITQQNAYLSKIIETQEDILGYARENNWALVFNNTITNSNWFSETPLSLGRWAIGYQCAYVLFRVLDEIQPTSILELGLGQSTKILGQYACNNTEVNHYVVEHDQSWIDFFKNNYEITNNSTIIQCDWDFIDYEGVEGVRVFADFKKKLGEKKFGLIMIDAPFGGDMPVFSRIDVLRNITDFIEDSFVIMIDDIDRAAELNTFKKMQSKLVESNIPYVAGVYRGKKSVGVIVSENFKFVLTM